jgi:hypothetical protein
MKVFLDTNVWSYVADHDAGDDLARAARHAGAEILVAPAIVDEVRELPNEQARRRVLQLITRPQWTRLMPDAYSECLELKAEISRLRPQWVLPNPNLREIRTLRYDWVRRSGGFWYRARAGILPAETDESVRQENEQRLAREDSYEMRRRLSVGNQQDGSTPLQHVAGLPDESTPGWNGDPVPYWRVPGLYVFWSELLVYTSPYRHWLDSELDVGAMLSDGASLSRLWLYEMSALAVPRQWIRGAFEFLQGWHRVTDGTPMDSQLSTHLVETDLFVSADRNFVRFAQRCKSDAPFDLARAQRVSAGRAGVDELLALLGSG